MATQVSLSVIFPPLHVVLFPQAAVLWVFLCVSGGEACSELLCVFGTCHTQPCLFPLVPGASARQHTSIYIVMYNGSRDVLAGRCGFSWLAAAVAAAARPGVCPSERKGEPAVTLHGEQSCLNIDQWGFPLRR